MKKLLTIVLSLALALVCVLPAASEEAPAQSRTLVAYFSRVGNTDFQADVDASSSASIVIDEGVVKGNAQVLAEYAAEITGGDLFLIETADKYPASYDETLDQASDEGAEGFRPEIVSQVENMGDYDTIILAYPNWWGDLPMAIYAFVEGNDLSNKTIAPMATSGGSALSGTVRTLRRLLPDSEVLDGLHVSGGKVVGAHDRVEKWLGEIGVIAK